MVWPGIGHTHRMRRGDRLFAGTHEFVIEPRPDGTVLFPHVEDVTGLLFPVFHAVMGARSSDTMTT